MFKYFHDSPHEESVYNLVTTEVNGEALLNKHEKNRDKTRYRSIHSSMVREEADKHKTWSAKTMGVPRLPIEGPEVFLKKHSKRPLSVRPKSDKPSKSGTLLISREVACQTNQHDKESIVEETSKVGLENANAQTQDSNTALKAHEMIRPKTCYQRLCLSSAKKPPIPDPKLGVNIVTQAYKDFIHSNALTVIGTQPKELNKPILYVDTPKGEKRQWRNSGLAPQYVHKKNFAHVPIYITLRKKEFLEQLKKKQEEEEQEKAAKSPVRILSIEERDKVIEGLKQNWNQIFSNYQRLPLLIDTPGKIKRKTSLEDQLKKLETDIQTLQRHDCIYVSDIAPQSFYAFSGNQK